MSYHSGRDEQQMLHSWKGRRGLLLLGSFVGLVGGFFVGGVVWNKNRIATKKIM